MPMTREEQDIITRYIERVSGRAAPAPGPGGSVPATIQPLPPVDPDADRLIADLMVRYPEARYRLTQTAYVQEHALVEAQNRIQRLEWELQQAQQAMARQQAEPQRSGGFFSSLFGGGSRPAPNPNMRPGGPMGGPPPGYGQQPGGYPPGYGGPPPPQYPPGYQPMAPQQRGGSGFLGSALTTAAGVAGGLIVGNMLMNAMSGHGAGLSGGLGAGGAAGAGAGGFVDQGGFTQPDSGAAAGGGAWDQTGADPGAAAGGAWDQGNAGGGWDQGGGAAGGGWDQGGGAAGGWDNSGGGGGDSGGGWDSGGGGGGGGSDDFA